MAAFWSGDLNPQNSKPLILKPGYNDLDPALTWTPDAAGDGHFSLYANVHLTFKPGQTLGKIRRRADRAKTATQPLDPTAYEDITIFDTSGAEFEWIIPGWWVGQVWKGRAMKWRLQIGPQFASAKLVTRYAKAYYL